MNSDGPIDEHSDVPGEAGETEEQPAIEATEAEATEAEATEAEAQPEARADVVEDAGASDEALGGAEADQPTAAATPDEQPLRIEIGLVEGSLTVIGGADQVTVSARHWHDDIETVQLSDGVRFSRLPGATELHAPDHVTINVREVDGDLHVERLVGAIRVNRVQRDARIEETGSARVTWVGGDLTVERVDQLEIEVSGGDAWLDGVSAYVMLGRVGGDLEARRLGALTVTEAVGGDAQIERCGPVTLEGPVGGDLELRRIEGVVRLTTTGGDLEITDAREVAGRVVGGDLDLDGIAGRAAFETISGDASLTNTFGPVSVGVVGGDLQVERAPGGVTVSRIGGDANLDTLLKPDAKYTINAGGDITLRVRGEANARFVAQSFGGEIHTRLPLTVERGRRRNLVGSLGSGAATVTLQSGGDITIVAADGDRGADTMSDENDNAGDQPGGPDGVDRTFEGNVGGRKFRVRVQNGPNRAGFQFKGPFHPEDEEGAREFNLEWERGRGAHASGEYSEQLDTLRDRAEQLARRAGEEARKYADAAAKRARETDWESVGREVRTTIERAMSDLEDAFGRVRREWEPRGGSTASSDAGARPSSGAQRVRIEQDEQPDAGAAWSASASADQDPDAVRRQVLEDLRNGRISLDEAERRLNNLR
ncbi:MAG TPA: DUF4097 family beta strand repeat-containing protein [Ktedonobacterales bacterium]